MSTFEDRGTPAETGCVQFADLFQDPLLEEPPTSGASAAERRRYAGLTDRAGEICSECPMMGSCLYDAVVRHDISGYVAGTTQRQRSEIRRGLGIVLVSEDFDTFAGAAARNRPVDHDEVVRLRRANPDETLESIAQRLGCSLSTVKRHLRRERAGRTSDVGVTPMRRSLPTMAEVLAVAARVVAPLRTRTVRRAA